MFVSFVVLLENLNVLTLAAKFFHSVFVNVGD